MTKKSLVSIIIPVYNEEKVIENCLESLAKQTYENLEIIVVDDGSDDNSKLKISAFPADSAGSADEAKIKIILLEQNHKGPGAARNLGVSKSKGEILVFVDADMEFEPDFVEKLIEPIIKGKTIGTFSKDEYLLNKDKVYARYWNLNLGRKVDRMHADNYPDTQQVFRAILKSEFDKAGGFDEKIGYTDDWSLSGKLGVMAKAAHGAKFYHRNPETLDETWKQARWFGKNEFLTGSLVRKFYNLWRYCPLIGVIKGVIGAIRYKEPQFLIFKIVYDTAVFTSVLLSFWGEQKAK